MQQRQNVLIVYMHSLQSSHFPTCRYDSLVSKERLWVEEVSALYLTLNCITWICLNWAVHDPGMMIQAKRSSLPAMLLPEITTSAFCKRFSLVERNWSELQQSTEEFVWELNSNSEQPKSKHFLECCSDSKVKWQICSRGGKMFSHICFPIKFILIRKNLLRKYFGRWECQKCACVREVAVLLHLALQTVSKYACRSTLTIKPAHEMIHWAYKHHFFHRSNASSYYWGLLGLIHSTQVNPDFFTLWCDERNHNKDTILLGTSFAHIQSNQVSCLCGPHTWCTVHGPRRG